MNFYYYFFYHSLFLIFHSFSPTNEKKVNQIKRKSFSYQNDSYSLVYTFAYIIQTNIFIFSIFGFWARRAFFFLSMAFLNVFILIFIPKKRMALKWNAIYSNRYNSKIKKNPKKQRKQTNKPSNTIYTRKEAKKMLFLLCHNLEICTKQRNNVDAGVSSAYCRFRCFLDWYFHERVFSSFFVLIFIFG